MELMSDVNAAGLQGRRLRHPTRSVEYLHLQFSSFASLSTGIQRKAQILHITQKNRQTNARLGDLKEESFRSSGDVRKGSKLSCR